MPDAVRPATGDSAASVKACVLARVIVVTSLILTGPALAHTAGGAVTGLQSGLIHPITGLDHLVAMVAVGLWGAQLGPPALWALPIAFPLVMAFGGILGIVGVPLPFADTTGSTDDPCPIAGIQGVELTSRPFCGAPC